MNLKPLQIFQRPLIIAIWFMAALTLSRLLLVFLHSERVLVTEGLHIVIGQGLRFDLILLGLIFALPMVLLPWLHLTALSRRIAAWLIPAFLAISIALAFFVEAASAPFIRQFDTRPNFIFVEYLAYPREVLATVSGMYLYLFIGVSLATLALAWALFRWFRKDPARDEPVSIGYCLLLTPLLLILFVGMIRSTLGHRPVNPSVAAFSSDSMVNTLPLSSPYLVLYSIYEKRRAADGLDFRYGQLPDDEMVKMIWEEMGIKGYQLIDPELPSLREHRATTPRNPPLNLVMIVLESVGAEHVSALNGRNLMPELASLADQGIWFDRLYATGMRSARGLEALVSGFTPSMAPAALKMPTAQRDFFTLAEFLRRQGYATSFIYGGESHFDNMRGFFLGNGFETVIDENDYPDPAYSGSWGVSDEDLFNRAHAELSNAKAPFFSLIFTSSNHEPFDIPAGRVSPEDDIPGTGEPPGRATAIKYSDWALGRFLEQARQSDYWENTVFLVVADHSPRAWGGYLVPTEKFRIPGVILGDTIEPRRITGITSQIDLLPTLLSLLGTSGPSPAIGRDLTREPWTNGSNRAMMQFHGLQAYIEGDGAVILQADRKPLSFHIDAEGQLEPDPDMSKLVRRRALAYAKWGPYLFQTGTYTLPAESEND